MSENQTATAILDQTRKVHQKNQCDKSSEEVKSRSELIKMMIDQYERTIIIGKKVHEAQLRQMALQEKISAEIQTETTKVKKHKDQLKTAIRRCLAKLQKANLESQLIEKNQARIRKFFS